MSTSLKYLLALFIVVAGLFGLSKLGGDGPAPLTRDATDPDLFLGNSRAYVKEDAYDRSLVHLDKAIQSIRDIEKDLDAETGKMLEESIADLEVIRSELIGDSLNLEDLNITYSEALNALTEAELIVSRNLLEHENSEDAKVALKYGMLHLKNTLKFTQGAKKNYEIHIYEEIDSLLADPNIGHDEMVAKLDHMIMELDSLLKDNLHNDKPR